MYTKKIRKKGVKGICFKKKKLVVCLSVHKQISDDMRIQFQSTLACLSVIPEFINQCFLIYLTRSMRFLYSRIFLKNIKSNG